MTATATNLEPVVALHAEIDAFLVHCAKEGAAGRLDFSPPCASCTSAACCSEACSAGLDEAQLILDEIMARFTATDIFELKMRVLAWYEKAQPLLAHPLEKIGIPWRLAGIPCPLLANGRCSVYEKRPLACRTFFAHSNPAACEMPARVHQKFACLEHNESYQEILLNYAIASGTIKGDHLGVLLYNRLFGKAEVSGAAYAYALEKIEEKP